MHTGGPDDSGAKGKPLVSVIIPTHNRAQCLPRALDSVYAQEGLGEDFDLEVIVVDDASSDATSEVIRRYRSAQSMRLPERRGVSAAMNAGLRAGRGRYVAFLDDDDEWLSHKLRVQVPLLETHPDVGVVYSQSLTRFGERERLRPDVTRAPSGWVFMAMLMDNFCGHHACFLVRRRAFDKAGYFDESLASYEDYDLSLRLAFHVPFLFVPGAVDVYNLSPQGLWLTRAASGSGAEDAARVIDKALRMLPESARYAQVKWEARAAVALETATRLGDLTQAWANVVAALRRYPGIVHRDWARGYVTQVVCKRALAAEAPIAAVRELCAEIKAASPHRGVRGWWAVRQMVAGIWAEIARSLAFGPRTSRRDAVSAAAFAVAHAPSYLMRKALVRVLVRSALGRRADALCMRVYLRVSTWRPPSRSALGAGPTPRGPRGRGRHRTRSAGPL